MRNPGQLTRAVCALLFCLFTFYYVFSYQCDLIAYAQMVLSEGMTHFDRTVGALLITVALYIVHLFVYGLVKPHNRYIALSYFPSLLILTVITDIPDNIAEHFSFGAWLWVAPLLLLLFVGLVVFLRQWSARWQASPFSLFHDAWVNLTIMAIMFLLAGLVGNGDEQFHRQLQMERLVIDGDYDEALSLDASAAKKGMVFTELVAFALSQQHEMGERFFEYPVANDAPKTNGHLFFVPEKVISMVKNTDGYKEDYELIALLKERRIYEFARKVKKCYADSVMPKHYREAMAIFNQSNDAKRLAQEEEEAMKAEMEKAKKERRGKRSSKKSEKKGKTVHPLDSIMSERYRAYQLLLESSSDKQVVYNLSRKYYAKTYWHYYHFK